MDNFPGKQSQFNDLKQASSNARRKQCLYGRGCSTLDWPTIFAELIKFLFSLVSDPSTERVIFIWEGLHLEQKKCAFCPPFTKHRCYCTVSTSSFHEVHSGLNTAIITWAGAVPLLCKHHTKQGETTKHEGAKRATSVSISEDPPCARFFGLANPPEPQADHELSSAGPSGLPSVTRLPLTAVRSLARCGPTAEGQTASTSAPRGRGQGMESTAGLCRGWQREALWHGAAPGDPQRLNGKLSAESMFSGGKWLLPRPPKTDA